MAIAHSLDEKNIDLGDDFGYVNLTMNGTEVRIDLWRVDSTISAMAIRHHAKQDMMGFYDAVVKYIVELGWPECSHGLAVRFVEAINQLMGRAKNPDAGESRPASPASTTSTPSF